MWTVGSNTRCEDLRDIPLQNCTTINYAPIILKSHNLQTRKQIKGLKPDTLPTLLMYQNPPSKITASWPLKMRTLVTKKKVKANM